MISVKECVRRGKKTVVYLPKVLPVEVRWHPAPNAKKGMRRVVYIDRVVMNVYV